MCEQVPLNATIDSFPSHAHRRLIVDVDQGVALTTNPKTPPPTAIKLLNHLTDRDVKTIMRFCTSVKWLGRKRLRVPSNEP